MFRSGGSHGTFDLIALQNEGFPIRLIQVKSTVIITRAKYMFSDFRKQLKKLKLPPGIFAELWIYRWPLREWEIINNKDQSIFRGKKKDLIAFLIKEPNEWVTYELKYDKAIEEG